MTAAIELHLGDIGSAMVDAWTREFAGVPSVTISRGDIFSTKAGRVDPGDPIDITADAIISPANSFGFMDGGIDAVYTYQFGDGLQRRLQERIAADHGGELPVGCALIVPTLRDEIPWCISAPTMRIPRDVSKTVHAYLAFRAALRAVLAHNASGQGRIERILCPGLATSAGRMPVDRSARQMRRAWDRVLGQDQSMPRSLRAAADDEVDLLS